MNSLPASLSKLARLVSGYPDRLHAIEKNVWDHKPASGKWSKKEILGHLIDSAHVNYDRLIRSQSAAQNIVYDQDKWVAVHRYHERDHKELIEEWVFMNKRLVRLAENIPSYSKMLPVGTDVVSLKDLTDDYVRHLLHHLDQVMAKNQ